MAKKNELKNLKVALVHDYLVDYGGAERVVEALHELFPTAPLYTSFVNKKTLGDHWQRFANWDIRESWLTAIPFHQSLFSPLRIFAPQYFRAFDLSAYDLVISSSNAYFAKAVRVRPGAIHVCYCHTPPRALYGYSTMTNWQSNPVIKWLGNLINHYLRVVDWQVSQQVPYFIANSQETAARIKKFYRRESVVIHPPVRVPTAAQVATVAQPPTATQVSKSPSGSLKPAHLPQPDGYFLYVNRLAMAKHPELAVVACSALNVPLKVVGTGPMTNQLRQLAGPTVELLGSVSDAQLDEYYQGATALLYPVEDEDFGIVPVEAMGWGVPVIAHRSGGPKETIIDGETGIFFEELTVQALTAAIKKFGQIKFDRASIQKHAQLFSEEKFKQKITAYLQKLI